MITPANKAMAVLFNYQPFAGKGWGGTSESGAGDYIYYWNNTLGFIAIRDAEYESATYKIDYSYKMGYSLKFGDPNNPYGDQDGGMTAFLPSACRFTLDIQLKIATTDRCRRYEGTDAGMNECPSRFFSRNGIISIFSAIRPPSRNTSRGRTNRRFSALGADTMPEWVGP